MPKRIVFIITALGMLLLLIACAGPATPAYQVVSQARFAPGSPIPPPSEKVILTISGDISVTNVGDTLQFDMPTLESLGLVKYTMNDPFLMEEVNYTGVLMSRVSEFVGAPDIPGNVRIVALDDYHVDLSLEDIQRWPVLLATRSNGEYLSIENAGPTRIVFPYHAHSELDPVGYDKKLWIWNVKSMQVD